MKPYAETSGNNVVYPIYSIQYFLLLTDCQMYEKSELLHVLYNGTDVEYNSMRLARLHNTIYNAICS